MADARSLLQKLRLVRQAFNEGLKLRPREGQVRSRLNAAVEIEAAPRASSKFLHVGLCAIHCCILSRRRIKKSSANGQAFVVRVRTHLGISLGHEREIERTLWPAACGTDVHICGCGCRGRGGYDGCGGLGGCCFAPGDRWGRCGCRGRYRCRCTALFFLPYIETALVLEAVAAREA